MAARISTAALLGAFAVLMLLMGFYLEAIVVPKVAVYVLFALVGVAIMVASPKYSILFLFFLIGIEGFLKLMTRYNPVVHVGADIFITLLCLRHVVVSLGKSTPTLSMQAPLTTLILIHFVWFAIAILNPYALNLVASLAGAKMYVTVVMLYFFGYYLPAKAEDVESFMFIWIVICLLHSVTGAYQAAVGPSSVTSLSPAYAVILKRYEGYAFRPFGLGSNPGYPAEFVMLSMPFMLYMIYQGKNRVFTLLSIITATLGVAVLFMCQVRASIVKTIIGASGFTLAYVSMAKRFGGRQRTRLVSSIALVALALMLIIPSTINYFLSSYSDNERAMERSLSVFNLENFKHARVGVLDRFVRYLKIAPLGAGLSRTGAASGKFAEDIKKSEFLRGTIFFADNMFVAIVVDLGLPGVIVILLLIILILTKGYLAYRQCRTVQNKALSAAILMALLSLVVGTYGGEALLYNPEAGFFWFFAGVLLKIPEFENRHRSILDGAVV